MMNLKRRGEWRATGVVKKIAHSSYAANIFTNSPIGLIGIVAATKEDAITTAQQICEAMNAVSAEQSTEGKM